MKYLGHKFHQALADAGLIDLDVTRKVVIVSEAGEVTRMYVETFADERLLDVILSGSLDVVADRDGDKTDVEIYGAGSA